MFENSIGITDEALVFLTAFIFADIRITNRKSIFSAFTIGLIVLGFGQLFYINLHHIQIFGIIAHLSK